jgi:hypothetical protein
VDYDAHHLDPRSFQLDHLWQIALGGPAYDYDNAGSSHRACNRRRSDTIDATTIAAAARYGVTLTPPDPMPVVATCAPDAQYCPRCNGTHNPRPGVTFITARDWWTNDVELTPP